MKRIISTAFCLMGLCTSLFAQTAEGSSYFLPKTAIRFTILIEKTTFKPGDFCLYAERYLRLNDVGTQASTSYRIVNLKIQSFGMPDTAKHFTANIMPRNNFKGLVLNDEGLLMAINDGKTANAETQEPFRPAPKPKALNPRDYLNQDILAAGSTAKMAELTAQEIYDIRDSKNQLTRGQADFMPKDGEQLKLMLQNLNTQESALLSLFEGTTETDTTETEIIYVPTKEVSRQVLFRFSRHYGMTDADDLSGKPYYISIDDLKSIPPSRLTPEEAKKQKNTAGIYINLPGKIKLSLFKQDEPWASFETYAAQFGRTEPLSDELFSRKVKTDVSLNPVTGSINEIHSELLK